MIDEIILEEIPENWEWANIKKNIEKIPLTGKKLKKGDYQEKGIIPVIDQGQDFIGGYTEKTEFKITVDSPLVIFGDHTRCFKYVDFDFVPGADGIKVIKPLKFFNPKLFFYFLQVVKLPNKGYARHFQYLEKSFIPLPPLNEQKRIVSKIEELFTNLDARIQELTSAKEKLKIYRQSVLKHAFKGKLTKEWREAHTNEIEFGSILLEIIRRKEKKKSNKSKELLPVDALKLHNLPNEWIWARIIDITDSMQNGIYKPKKFYNDDGIACLRMYNIENGSIVWKDIKRMNLTSEEIERYALKHGDILVNRVNSRELVGKSALITPELETCVYESKNIRLRLLSNYIDSKYVNYWLRLFCHAYFNYNAQQTVGMASINQIQLGSMPIPFLSLIEQRKIVKEIESRFTVIDEIEKTIDHNLIYSQKLRQSILKKAFQGQLVSQDPNDEPAEKLLERIKAEKEKQKSKRKTRKKTKSKQKVLV